MSVHLHSGDEMNGYNSDTIFFLQLKGRTGKEIIFSIEIWNVDIALEKSC